ncbi:MAG: cation diffusion facilitator family transporter [Wenzhouxiangella sp.]
MSRPAPRDDSPPTDWPAKRRVTLVGATANLFLAIGKVIAGVLGHSQALVADGVHSLSDLISDVLVLAAAHWGSHGADENHPYGHARIETVGTAIVGILLLAVAAGFLVDSIGRLMSPERLLQPGWLALSAAVVSVATKEVLYHYTQRVARSTRSALIAANAWHHRTDALSSVVVILGVLGAMMGLFWLDAVAAIVVAMMVGWVGWKFMGASVAELVDTGLSPGRLKTIDRLILSVDGVHGYRQLRTRRMGGQAYMDVQILLDPDLTLAEADVIAMEVQQLLISEVRDMADVVVDIRPYHPRR